MFALKHKTYGICGLNVFQGEEYDWYTLEDSGSSIWVIDSLEKAEMVRTKKGTMGYGSESPDHDYKPDDLEIVSLKVESITH